MADDDEDEDVDTRTDDERELDALPDGLAFAYTMRDVARATLAHNPVRPDAQAWRRLLRVCERIAPDVPPDEPAPIRRSK